MTFAKITDGSSKTIVAGEKWLHPQLHDGNGAPHNAGDDRGWADGWDCNNLRSTALQPRPDTEGTLPNDPETPPDGAGACDEIGDVFLREALDDMDWVFGSSHPGGLNVVFADASVQFINYDVDLENFNRLGHRRDGEPVDLDF